MHDHIGFYSRCLTIRYQRPDSDRGWRWKVMDAGIQLRSYSMCKLTNRCGSPVYFLDLWSIRELPRVKNRPNPNQIKFVFPSTLSLSLDVIPKLDRGEFFSAELSPPSLHCRLVRSFGSTAEREAKKEYRWSGLASWCLPIRALSRKRVLVYI